jgi:hypothetical protein
MHSSDTSDRESPASATATGLAQATGELIKSVGRFSLAVSLLAARQVTALFSGPEAREGGALDDVSRAMGGHLSGPVRTAFAVGTNVQSGVVDAAFSLAGMRPAGQTPTGETSGLAIPMTTGATRRVAGVRTVASGALSRPVPQTEFVQRLTEYHDEATGEAADRERAVIGLWKSEGLSTSVGKHLTAENHLHDPKLPRSSLPIAHVGFGSGSTESLVFDVAGLDALFAERCAPEFRGFSYEGIGAILRIYERGFFKVMSGTLGLIRLDAPDGPDPANFFGAYLQRFPPDMQRLIAHGYGRIVAFSSMNIYGAIETATAFPAERVEPAVHGAAFAFAFMNSPDMPRILRQSAIPFDAPVRAAFQNGLIYSLVFFEWYTPGLLAAWQPEPGLEAELIEHARAEAALSVQRGHPLAFKLADPRT